MNNYLNPEVVEAEADRMLWLAWNAFPPLDCAYLILGTIYLP